MSALSWYPELKHLHITLVAASGLLFAVRGVAVLVGQRWAMRKPWRWLSYGIDTLLLGAGVTLWVTLAIHPVHSPWLATKLLLLVVYILLGSLALKRAPNPVAQRLSFVAALAVYGFMVSVASTHHPLGALRSLAGAGP
jgi:uncharacterized membrane protein SirB2